MSDPIGKKPRTESEDAQAVTMFAADMLRKMRDNAHKAHWDTVDFDYLFDRLLEEQMELVEAIEENAASDGKNWQAIIDEAADVANLAMMIADRARREIV